MKNRSAFTLVELVIVILILGILAAVAVPRLFNTSATATDNGLKQTLGVLRDAIELYAADNGALPGQSDDLPTDLGPYIRGPFPNCPVGSPTDPDGVTYATGGAPLAGAASPTATGWKYNKDTGEFIINFNGASQVTPTVNYDQF